MDYHLPHGSPSCLSQGQGFLIYFQPFLIIPPRSFSKLVTDFFDKNKILCTFQKEQEEIMEKRPSTQKGLDLKEIKQMEYLSKVYILYVNYLF